MVKPDGDDVLTLIDALINELDVFVAASTIGVGDHHTLVRIVLLELFDEFCDRHQEIIPPA
jgi:hypothetical protein